MNNITYTIDYLKDCSSDELIKLWCEYRAANDLTRPFNIIGDFQRQYQLGRIAVFDDNNDKWLFVNSNDEVKSIVFANENNYEVLANWLNQSTQLISSEQTA